MFISSNPLTNLELTSAIIRNPLVVRPEAMVMEAIAQMSERRSHYVLVVDNEQLLGLLTEQDVVDLIAQHQFLDCLVMREVMTDSMITLKESDFTDALVA